MRPVLVLGGSGQLGRALAVELSRLGLPFVVPSRSAFDLTDLEQLDPALDRVAPGAVVNAAAFTDVAAAELPQHAVDLYRLNRDAPAALARGAGRLRVPLVHVSTDYVFDGRSGVPYGESDVPGPLQEYGRSKLAGERAVLAALPEALIVRTSTLYGRGPRARPHYVDAILAQARLGRRIEVVRTPVSSPTYAADLAAAIVELLRRGASGTVHVANDGAASRLELARETVRCAGLATAVEIVERTAPAGDLARPAYSVLDTARFRALTGRPMRPWAEALSDYVSGR